MGLLRRFESRIQGGFEGVFGRKSGGGVQSPELARKLVKEMDDHRTDSLARVYAPNHFTIYLCPADRARLRSPEASMSAELARYVEQHARSQGYSLVGSPVVAFTVDTDLRPGQFGILAEMIERPSESPPPRVAAPVSVVPPAAVRPTRAAFPAVSVVPTAGARPALASVQNIWPPAAAAPAPARQTLLMRHGSHVQEFQKNRVVLGRSRDADFRLHDPNISRRHAVVYWEGGRAFVKDLGSTNGTLLNGCPVASSALEDGDVLTIGGCTVLVETE